MFKIFLFIKTSKKSLIFKYLKKKKHVIQIFVFRFIQISNKKTNATLLSLQVLPSLLFFKNSSQPTAIMTHEFKVKKIKE